MCWGEARIARWGTPAGAARRAFDSIAVFVVILTVELPNLGPAVEGASISTWHKQPGETVAYGDDLCDVTVEQVTRMRRRLNPKDTVDRKAKRATFKRGKDVRVHYRIVSVDVGTLTAITAPVGTEVRVGDPIASITVAGEEESGSEIASHTSRVAVNRIESTGQSE